MLQGDTLQRLFSMFPNGWPGKGLLVLRLTVAALLIRDGICAFELAPLAVSSLLTEAAALAGIFLLLGLWTPLAALLLAAAELALLPFANSDLRTVVLYAAIGFSLALLGPGNWSIDAVLFGRIRIDLPKR